jgi:hypothetical protein
MTARTILFAAALPLVGCGGGDNSTTGGDEGPVYVMMTQVYTADDRVIYFSTSDSLDIDSVDFGNATEAFGVANFTTLDGRLYISSGEEPKITQYNVKADHSLEETGAISFGAYPLGDNANFYYHLIVDENLAYLPYEETKRIAWSPKDMTILDDMNTSTVPATNGALKATSAGNRTGIKFPNGPVMAPFFYTDEMWSDFGTKSQIATYDKTSHTEAKIQEVGCPGLALTTRDESGNTYFSTNMYSPVKYLYGVGPAPCVVRAKPDGNIDTAWTTDLTSMTGGRYVSNFRYLHDGLAFGYVFDHASAGFDLNMPYDPAFEELAYEASLYKLWLFDLETGTGKEITGLDVGEAYQHAVIDGRMFLMAIYDDYGKTRVYELGTDGVLTKKFDVDGDVFKWEKLR